MTATQEQITQQIKLLEEISRKLSQSQEQQKKQHRELKRQTEGQELTQGWILLGVTWAAYLAVIAVPPGLTALATSKATWNAIANSTAGRMANLPAFPTQDSPLSLAPGEPLKAGDTIAGFKVTSARGNRKAPCEGCSSQHEGVDVATPTGTPLYAPAAVTVACSQDPGGGTVAQFELGGATHKFLHLSTCKAGHVKPGKAFAATGSSGRGTGPHLDYRVKQGADWVEPYQAVLAATLDPKAALFDIGAFKAAIAAKESGSDYSRINVDSGALGKYQFMPATMRSNAKACLGVTPSDQEFLANPELQEQVMGCYLKQGLKVAQQKTTDPVTQCRMVAAWHYAGDVNLFDNTSRQTYNGNEYPTIAQYTTAVCKGL